MNEKINAKNTGFEFEKITIENKLKQIEMNISDRRERAGRRFDSVSATARGPSSNFSF